MTRHLFRSHNSQWKIGKTLFRTRVLGHYEKVWGLKGNHIEFNNGPVNELPEGFGIFEFPPHRARKMWTYATCCMSRPEDQLGLELHLFSPQKSLEPVEILVATAHFHRTGICLGLGHTVNFGKGWLGGSKCEYGLISLPYLDGPDLENLSLSDGGLIKCLWLVPITKSEAEFKRSYGLNALEENLENAQFNYLDPFRKSVC